MHRASVDASTELWDLMTTMVSSATKLYVSTPPSLRLKLQSKSRPPWPSSTSDLVPYGLQASLDSMIDLVRHGIPSAFHILYAIGVAFGRSTVMKILVDHPDLPTALYYYLSIWEYFTAQIPLDDYSAVQTRITAAATGAVKTMEFIADLCGSPADALRRFMARAGAPRDQFVVLWSSLLTLWRRAQAIIPKDLLLQNRPAEVLLNSMLYSVICTYAGAGAVLHAVLKLPRDEIYYDPRILQLSEALPTWNPLYNRLEVTARQAADNPRCFGPGCVETEATAGRKFHVCGGCGHMKYCSKECQRRAWKDQRASHK
ncbi:hypothetical protein PUNSTDRAFT_132306 [Punctularia strigosozonata HHB-11173 SS5]|uniref:uncharacterized protein n=1 Tax=Punctularia strigosozonata (strain HHB-11173) TaxID=741275 RepID=UPI00044179B7|nr:uncharacterized protein PUNSTDRAFT_132306 [Punctularia strigosozonata HHB-11173 SS5]EIN10208.1 hypothetical protein PUNSTDRAFT_132306 [Punctularia strigosozonata HHB-11173 SS5]